jgi:capsular polysaccharide biosynthesis protein
LLEILNEHNFEIVDLDTISVIEQIMIFSSAKIIVGIHGAGLVNIFFCGAGSKLMEIYPPNYFDPSIRLLAINLNIEYTYIIGNLVNYNNPQHTDIHIDKALFEKALIKFDQT